MLLWTNDVVFCDDLFEVAGMLFGVEGRVDYSARKQYIYIYPIPYRMRYHPAIHLQNVVRFIENTMNCKMFPCYSKTGASSLMHL